jgi:hypothetical protein
MILSLFPKGVSMASNAMVPTTTNDIKNVLFGGEIKAFRGTMAAIPPLFSFQETNQNSAIGKIVWL